VYGFSSPTTSGRAWRYLVRAYSGDNKRLVRAVLKIRSRYRLSPRRAIAVLARSRRNEARGGVLDA